MTFDEVRHASAGVLLLFRGRPEGLLLMDRSVDGFWRSFLTILLVLPSVALSVVATNRITGGGAFLPSFAGAIPLVALDYALMPVLVAAIARPLKLTRGYVDFVVARNWGAPIATALLAVPGLLEGAGWIGAEPSMLASIVMLGLVLRYQWVLLRLALRTDVPIAVALLTTEFVISLLLVAVFTEA